MVMGALTALIIDSDEDRQKLVQALQDAGFQVIQAVKSLLDPPQGFRLVVAQRFIAFRAQAKINLVTLQRVFLRPYFPLERL